MNKIILKFLSVMLFLLISQVNAISFSRLAIINDTNKDMYFYVSSMYSWNLYDLDNYTNHVVGARTGFDNSGQRIDKYGPWDASNIKKQPQSTRDWLNVRSVFDDMFSLGFNQRNTQSKYDNVRTFGTQPVGGDASLNLVFTTSEVTSPSFNRSMALSNASSCVHLVEFSEGYTHDLWFSADGKTKDEGCNVKDDPSKTGIISEAQQKYKLKLRRHSNGDVASDNFWGAYSITYAADYAFKMMLESSFNDSIAKVDWWRNTLVLSHSNETDENFLRLVLPAEQRLREPYYYTYLNPNDSVANFTYTDPRAHGAGIIYAVNSSNNSSPTIWYRDYKNHKWAQVIGSDYINNWLNSDKVKNIRNTTDLKNVILDLANSNTYDVKKIFVKWAKPIVLNCTMKPRQMSGYNLTWYDTRANQFLPLDQKWFDNSKYGISADNIVNPYIWNDINKNKNLTNSDPDVDFDAGINAGLNEDANSIVADSHYFYKSNNNNVHYETIFKFLAEPQIDILCPVEETSGEYSATAYAKGKHQSTDKPGIGFLEAPYYPGYSNTD